MPTYKVTGYIIIKKQIDTVIECDDEAQAKDLTNRYIEFCKPRNSVLMVNELIYKEEK